MKPVFERNADQTLAEVRATYAERGAQYADSWHTENMVITFTRETLARFGITLDLDQIRLLQAAALIDIKDSRIGGGFKKDSVVDSIAYRACYANLRDEYEQAHPPNMSLAELLSGGEPHPEIDTGPAVGREFPAFLDERCIK